MPEDNMEEVDGVISEQPFHFKGKSKGKDRCTKIKCKSGDGDFIELEICIQNGNVTDCRKV